MLIQDYVSTIPKTPYAHKGFEESISFNKKSFKLEDQSQEWQSQMRNFGQRMNEKGVCLIYFVHGTFAGDSPLGFVKLFDQKHSSFGALCKKFTKEYIVDIVLGDCGNYAKKYVELFEKAIDNKICCKRPIWSSEDNHVGRLIAAMELVKTIAKDIEHPKINRQKKRILLQGHSHAGQLFALISNFLFSSSPEVGKLCDIALNSKRGKHISKFDESLQAVKQHSLDFVTFGTPPLYKWAAANDYRLLNIINHRGYSDHKHLANVDLCTRMFYLNFPLTKDGDYVQQFGITGSDLPTIAGRDIKEQLSEIFGKKTGLIGWLKKTKIKMRVPSHGKTILVDYKDNNTYLPNCHKTLLGHGVYTRFEKMLFNTKLIVDEMY